MGHVGLRKQRVETSCCEKVLIPEAPWPKLAAPWRGGVQAAPGASQEGVSHSVTFPPSLRDTIGRPGSAVQALSA